MNRLGQEKSPYLLQHKDNPVWWYAWGPDAFKAAKKEGKPIFLSVGYSTCHWCHVMEHESFEKQEVADLLNKHFIAIKVDREERPDVDRIYMDAVMAMRGQGGWPMSVFLTPDLNPFWGGTYFPKDQFMSILTQISTAWSKEREKMVEAGKQLTAHIQKIGAQSKGTDKLNEKALRGAFHHRKTTFDSLFGGFGDAPKFPPSAALMFLLRVARRAKSKEALSMVETTLQKMAYGGMYDHLGGGFSRYSTDQQWLVPHFEKMLYDNALLSMAYLEAYQVTKKELYKQVAQEILDYVLRMMTHSAGGFYSAEDADSEGVEGKFYVWTYDELKEHLSEKEFKKFVQVYGVTQQGNFEHKNILNLQDGFSWDIKNDPLIQSASKKLFEIREKRIHPYKDDKILTAWNGLMIASMAKAFQVTGDERYLKAAERAALFIKEHLFKGVLLLRRFRDGEAAVAGTLDDYAFLVHGLLTLYEADFNPEWITWARTLQSTQDDLLGNEEGGYFYTSKKATDLIRRSLDFHDGAKPNANAVATLNLLRLYDFTYEKKYQKKAIETLLYVGSSMEQYPGGFAQMLVALDYHLDRSKEIAVIGKKGTPQTQEMLTYLHHTFLPSKVVAFAEPDKAGDLPLTQNRPMKGDKTTVYVCEDGVCKLPVTDLKAVQKLVSELSSYSTQSK